MQIIALINQKSGVGKITCAINNIGGAGLNNLNKRVLLIDLDPPRQLPRAFKEIKIQGYFGGI
jgi:cellulose biosynthesis protein BcsQ